MLPLAENDCHNEKYVYSDNTEEHTNAIDLNTSENEPTRCDSLETEQSTNVTRVNEEIFDAVWTVENCQNEILSNQRNGELGSDDVL